jgi:[acyl-carrier-protein] S-malonyltransferase
VIPGDADIAIVFPGQGTQKTGMASDAFEASAAARDAFTEASDALGLDVAALCFEPDARLELTEFAQPAILTAEIALLRALTNEAGLRPMLFGGHSLGEYTALVAAGVVALGEAAWLVHQRGRLMQEAVPVGEGSMVAVVQPGLDLGVLQRGIADLEVDVANVNSPDQVVLSGRKDDVAAATKRLRDIPGFERARTLPLKVSAPFHSRWMKPAERALRPLLESRSARWNAAHATNVACNLTGAMHTANTNLLVDRLARQVTAPVLWLDDMRALAARSKKIYEIGPGKPLRAFFAAVGVEVTSITTWEAGRALETPHVD